MIVIGTDHRDGGEDALELGRLLAAGLGTDVLPVSVLVTGASPGARSKLSGNDHRVVIAPSVADGLREVAREAGAVAIVIGSSHRGRVGRTVLGTGAERIARVAPCPIAVAPKGYARRYATRLRNIDVSFDGSAAGADAVGLAGRIAAGDGGHVLVRTAQPYVAAAEQALATSPAGVTYEVEVGDGEPTSQPTGGADMLVIGRDQRHPLNSLGCAVILA